MSENAQPNDAQAPAIPSFVAGASFEALDLDTFALMKTKVVKDNRFTVFTTKDKTAAFLIIEGGFGKATGDNARAFLKEAGIALEALGEAELSSYLIGKGTKNGKPGGVRVAMGQAAVNGDDGWIEWHVVEPESFGVGKEAAGGAVDYRERQTFSKVTKGEPILTWHPQTKGENGRDIFGKLIEAMPGQPNKPRAGVNVSTDGEGKSMSAGIDGVVKLEEDSIHVRLMLEVQDVDFASGNINFDGDVQVNGDVKEGFEVHSKGAVQVLGRVHKANISASTLFIEGTISGATITVLEHAELGGLDNTTLMVGSDLTLKGDVVASTVNVGGALKAAESKFVGGSLNALGMIEIASLGTAETDLSSNALTIAIPQTAEVDSKRAALQEGIAKLNAALDSSEEADETGKKPKLSLQQKQALNALRKKRDDLTKALEEADKERRITLHRLMKDMPRGTIVAHAGIAAGARIVIDGYPFESDDALEGGWKLKVEGEAIAAEHIAEEAES